MGKRIKPTVQGTVSTYFPDKAYGFVTTVDLPDDVGKDVDAFFHLSDVYGDSVKEGWRLKFSLWKNSKGYRAKDVKIISKEKRESLGQKRKRRHGLNKDEPLPDDWDRKNISAEFLQDSGEDGEDEEEKKSKKRSPFDDNIRGSMNDELLK